MSMATKDERPKTWLDQHLRRALGTSVSAIYVRVTRCPSCKARVLSGLSDTACAFLVRCDPYPLHPAGEAMACIDGRPTYAVHYVGNRRYQFAPRDRWQILGSPASLKPAIVVEHLCGEEPYPTLDQETA